MMKNACIRQLEVIGEASSKISDEVRAKNKDVKWKQIIGLRNILIHQYFGVDDKVVWDILKFDLPEFKIKIQKILTELNK